MVIDQTDEDLFGPVDWSSQESVARRAKKLGRGPWLVVLVAGDEFGGQRYTIVLRDNQDRVARLHKSLGLKFEVVASLVGKAA